MKFQYQNMIKLSCLFSFLLISAGCSMFYGKVSGGASNSDDSNTKIGISDVAVTTFNFSEDSSMGGLPSADNLGFSLTVASSPKSASTVAFGNEFSLVGTGDLESEITGRFSLAIAGEDSLVEDKNTVNLTLTVPNGFEIENKKCQTTSEELTLDTETFECEFDGTWAEAAKLMVNVSVTADEGLIVTVSDADSSSVIEESIEIPEIASYEIGSSVKAFTRALQTFGSCSEIPSGSVSFSSPILGEVEGKQEGDGSTINSCAKNISIECADNICSHKIGTEEF